MAGNRRRASCSFGRGSGGSLHRTKDPCGMGSRFWSGQPGSRRIFSGLRSSSSVVEVRGQELRSGERRYRLNLGAAKGIETAMHDFGATSRPYNIAVLLADHESFYVYLYPAQVTAGIYPLGADVRYHVSPDGTKIIETSFGPSRPRS